MITGPIEGVRYERHQVGSTDYLVATAGSGEPVLLLHGFPQTHYCWRYLIPTLAHQGHSVVAPDLRGYGGSRADAGGPRGEGFSKREIAAELVELMRLLGFDRFAVVGHDRGARAAYRMALDRPESVQRLAVLNVIPTVDQFARMANRPSLDYWPWLLLAQPAPFPEQLLEAAPKQFLRFIFASWPADPGAIDEQAFAVYLDALNETTSPAICGDYRASFWLDQEHEEARPSRHRTRRPLHPRGSTRRARRRARDVPRDRLSVTVTGAG
jgi:haloacetate dehalogenase